MTKKIGSRGSPMISLVVPIKDEEPGIEALADEVRQCLNDQSWQFEVIFCDDGSSDSSWAVIESLSAEDHRIHGVSLSRNFGKEGAILAGLTAARGDAVVVMDGDGQHPVELVPKMVDLWHGAGVEIVEAVKVTRPDQGIIKRAASRLFNRLFSSLTGVKMDEATDFRLLSRQVVDELLEMPERSVFFRGLSSWAGFETRRIQFEPRPRDRGDSSRFTTWALVRFAIRSLIAFTSAPLHLVTTAGLVFGVFAVLLGAHTLYRWFAGMAVEGFTTVILLLLFMGSVIMLALGVIGLYIAQIHKEVKRRPRFIVSKRTSGLR